jgi:hypothetical protein
LKEIEECQAYNLSFLNEDKGEESLPMEQLFKRFCFPINMSFNVFASIDEFNYRFISTDKYLSPDQIKCFQEVIKHMFIGDKSSWRFENSYVIRSREQIVIDEDPGKLNNVS